MTTAAATAPRSLPPRRQKAPPSPTERIDLDEVEARETPARRGGTRRGDEEGIERRPADALGVGAAPPEKAVSGEEVVGDFDVGVGVVEALCVAGGDGPGDAQDEGGAEHHREEPRRDEKLAAWL